MLNNLTLMSKSILSPYCTSESFGIGIVKLAIRRTPIVGAHVYRGSSSVSAAKREQTV